MKKLLTVTLVLVFTCALVFALGCAKKAEQTGMEGEQGMDQSATPPATGMMDTTGAAMTMPDTTKAMGN
jgi:hypothetical protein